MAKEKANFNMFTQILISIQTFFNNVDINISFFGEITRHIAYNTSHNAMNVVTDCKHRHVVCVNNLINNLLNECYHRYETYFCTII